MSINLRSFQPDGVAGLLFCLALAVVFVGGVFGLDFVAGHSAFWRTEVRDVTQYVAGFNFYFNAPWQSPWLSFDCAIKSLPRTFASNVSVAISLGANLNSHE